MLTAFDRAFGQIPGRGRVVDLLGRIAARVSPEGLCRPHRNARISVRLTDRIERLMWGGVYETELVTLMTRFLGAGMVFADVGAHVGYFTAVAACLVGETGKVHAFEPDPANYRRLADNTAKLTNVRCYSLAVSDAVGSSRFFRSPLAQESGWGSLLTDGERREAIRTETTSLDAWAVDQAVTRMEFVKIDVEGAEVRVLRGASSVLTRMRPVLFGEVNPTCLARDGETPGSLVKVLENYGYVVASVFSGKAPVPGSFFAAPKEKADQIDEASRHGLKLVPCVSAT
jgi:FkbM family methyltransferase